MRKILFYISILLFLILPIAADAAWYNSSWLYRIPITIDNTKVDADLTDFPVYVNLNDLSSDFHTNVKSDGCDIRVTTSDGSTEVPIDLVFYTAASDTGELHFKAPTLANSSDTTFYVYYGNSGASCLAENATYGAQNTWRSEYKLVLHLQEDPSTGTGALKDSTANNNDATGYADTGLSTLMASSKSVAGKLAGNAIQFDGNQIIQVPNHSSIQVGDGAAVVSVWTYADTLPQYSAVFDKAADTTGNQREYGLWLDDASGTGFLAWGNSSGTASTAQTASTGAWELKGLMKRTSDSTLALYSNATRGNSRANVLTGTNTASLQIGHYHTNETANAGGNDWDGNIDEVRIWDGALADTWISTEYKNQNSPSTFYTDGVQESSARIFTLKRPPNNFLGLVVRYTFDGGDMVSNIADSSGNANHGFLQGQTSTTTAIGKLGQALSFDGVNDYVSESAIDLSGTNVISVSLWMRKVSFGAGTDKVLFEVTTNTNNNTTGLFFTAEPSLGGGSTCTAGSQPLMAIAVKGDVGYDAHCYTAPSVNEWHHYVALYDKGQAAGSETSLYIDGVLQTPTGSANSCCSNNTNNFGNNPWYFMSRAGSTLFNDGSLDDIRIYSRALSASEINQLYNSAQSKINSSGSGAKGNTSGLTGYWSMNGGDMLTRVEDRSGNSRHGYISGQTSTTTTIGKLGQALSFDGTNDVVNTNVALSNFISGSAGTMSVWMRPDTTVASNNDVFNLPMIVGDTGGYVGIHVGTVSGQPNKIWVYNYDGNSDFAGITYTPNEWIHVVWVNDGGTLRAYANGVATTTAATGNTQNLTGTVRMGLSFGSAYYDGLVDEVRIYNRVLTPAEVKQLYLTGQVKLVQ